MGGEAQTGADSAGLERKIGYTFRDKNLLCNALTHTSFANESKKKVPNNERLEFLGDSVLSIIVAEYLYALKPALPEGDLTRRRAALVCEPALGGFARQIDLGEYLLLGKGEDHSGGRDRDSILSDAMEALIAAIYLDGGFKAARAFVLGFVQEGNGAEEDYKTRLQEVVQQNREERVRYHVTDEQGPDHDKQFTVEVHLNSNCIGRGVGHSKKLAEQQAAKEALILMGLVKEG
ncbi:ribonuclease III [Ruminococcaceae bacterium OttesenSCG-928-I18]|nr:ribonuclease III [Ruminococcaceae bacterium OttesenSCG-928-I18]